MVSRTTVMTLPLALALALAGCSGAADETSEETPAAEATQSSDAAATPQESESDGSEQPTEDDDQTSSDVKDLPDFLKPYPDSTVLSSSRAKDEAASDSSKFEQVSLVVKAKAKPKDILKFYDKALGKADFESYGEEVKTKSAQVVNYRHKDNDGLLVVTIAEDPTDDANSIVTIGGNIVP